MALSVCEADEGEQRAPPAAAATFARIQGQVRGVLRSPRLEALQQGSPGTGVSPAPQLGARSATALSGWTGQMRGDASIVRGAT
mmetsp:Transcript_8367/g.23023  ORF Transcript_8367/g.23023 Transcript_8367/m.23023 type:complete len:84 (-) Transcript_8367:1012-1263(-)